MTRQIPVERRILGVQRHLASKGFFAELWRPDFMIQNSFIDYVAIRISIAAFRLIAPSSIIYLLCCAFRPQWWNTALGIIAAAEASFYLLAYLPRRARLQAPPAYPPPVLSRAERELILARCLETAEHAARSGTSGEPNEPYLTGWFLDLPPNTHPKREDAIDWLLWALFSTSREDVNMDDPELIEELDGYLAGFEKMLGRALEPGSANEGRDRIKSIRVTLDPVRMLHRPLIWYLIVALVDAYTSFKLFRLGFRHYTPRAAKWRLTFPPRPLLFVFSRWAPEGVAVPYWYRPHRSRTKMPLIFMHGIGIGLYPYIPFITSLISGDATKGPESADDDVGILLPELMPISMHMTPRSVPPRHVMLESLELILDSLNLLEDEERTRNCQKPAPKVHEVQEGDSAMRQPLLSRPKLDEPDVTGNPAPTPAWNRVVLAAHSYGTFVAGWIVRLCVDADLVEVASTAPASDDSSLPLSRRIAHLVLVDPIPILLSHPAVAHNFLYRDPSTVHPDRLGSVGDLQLELESDQVAEADDDLPISVPPTAGSIKHDKPHSRSCFPFSYPSAAAWQLYYFASRDADVARTLHRAFFWAEGGIWREEVEAFVRGPDSENAGGGRNMAVFLGGMDQIVPAEAIRRYLTREEKWKERWTSGVSGNDPLSDGEDVDDEGQPVATQESTTSHKRNSGKLEVVFNPRLDHAVLFDEERWTVPLVDILRKYVRDV